MTKLRLRIVIGCEQPFVLVGNKTRKSVVKMYLDELKAYYPRQIPHIQRTGVRRLKNISSPSSVTEQEPVKTRQITIKTNRKVRNILLGPFNFFCLFLKTSSISGLGHLAAKKRHTFEYILWLGAITAAIYGFVTISLMTLSRYRNNPTVITLERNYKDWNTTLPAATICPHETYDEENLNNFLKTRLKQITGKKPLESAKKFLDTLAKANYSSFNMLEDFSTILPTEYLDAVVDMRYNFDYTVSSSNFENENLEEQELVLNINEIRTCYSYNSQVAIYLNPQSWKSGNYSHVSTTFSIVGNPLDGDIFTQVANMHVGYSLYLHSPQEVPDITSKGSSSAEGTFRTQDVFALAIISSPELRGLSIAQRKCRFPEESYLKISPVYSYNLCRMECRMKLAFKICGCVPYFYKPSDEYKVCDVAGMRCLTENKEILIKLIQDDKPIKCDCLPTCDDIIFVIESDSTMVWPLGTNLKWGLIKYPRQRLRRDVIFGIADVLVAMGGTAGLFFGSSVLSLVEILYFFTLRLWWFMMKKR